jgi:hypothetical protein
VNVSEGEIGFRSAQSIEGIVNMGEVFIVEAGVVVSLLSLDSEGIVDVRFRPRHAPLLWRSRESHLERLRGVAMRKCAYKKQDALTF